jgi:DnaJ-class molecular chaperone
MMSIPTTVACRNCGGLGLCSACNGTGRAQCAHCDDGYVATDYWSYNDEPFQSIEPCDYCGGSGVQPCADCGGSGLCDLCGGAGTEEVA